MARTELAREFEVTQVLGGLVRPRPPRSRRSQVLGVLRFVRRAPWAPVRTTHAPSTRSPNRQSGMGEGDVIDAHMSQARTNARHPCGRSSPAPLRLATDNYAPVAVAQRRARRWFLRCPRDRIAAPAPARGVGSVQPAIEIGKANVSNAAQRAGHRPRGTDRPLAPQAPDDLFQVGRARTGASSLASSSCGHSSWVPPSSLAPLECAVASAARLAIVTPPDSAGHRVMPS